MQKFLNYKSKIVKSKRDSQKIKEGDLFHLVRQYQQLTTIKKQMNNKGQLETLLFHTIQSPISKEQLLERSQINTLNDLCDSQCYQNDQISMEKQQSTMSSLVSSESKDSIKYQQLAKIPYIPCSCLRYQHPYQFSSTSSHKNVDNDTNSILGLQERVHERRQLLSAKQKIEIFLGNDEEIIHFYEQSQCKQNYYLNKNPSSLQAFNTSRQPLQLSQLHLSKSKIRQRSFLFEDQGHIMIEDEDTKVEMIFREEYKEIFLSSMSNIQFNEFTNSSNSLKHELDGSQSLFLNDSPKVSKFQTILAIINQKDSKNEQKTEKQKVNDQVPQRRRQKVMILNPKQPTNCKHVDKVKNSKAVKPMQKKKRTAPRK